MQNLRNCTTVGNFVDMKEIFGKALGIDKPWFVSNVNFDLAAKWLDIYIDFAKRTAFPFEQDGIINEYKAYDTVEKEWRHLNFVARQKDCSYQN